VINDILVHRLGTERIDLQKAVQQAGRKMASDLDIDTASIVYIALLYNGKEGIRVGEGQFPPFKIIFRTKEQGIEFKEKAVQASKDPKHPMSGAYFTTQQTPGTRIRTNIMWNMVEKIKKPEKGIDAWVNQNISKPTLQVKGEDKFQKSYSFVNAIQKYGTLVDDKTKENALKLAKRFYPNQVSKIFLIIKE